MWQDTNIGLGKHINNHICLRETIFNNIPHLNMWQETNIGLGKHIQQSHMFKRNPSSMWQDTNLRIGKHIQQSHMFKRNPSSTIYRI